MTTPVRIRIGLFTFFIFITAFVVNAQVQPITATIDAGN